jgi:hypothetical protein
MKALCLAPPVLALFLVLGASRAEAHVRLMSPLARYPVPEIEDSQNIKQGPCGRTGDGRTTDASRINHFRPGEKIAVEFNETIDHPGHFRIAFDDDGQDFEDPASATDIQGSPMPPVLVDGIPDDPTLGYTVEITLPDVECDNCTLQVIQVMTDKLGNGWGTDDVYHQCADLVLSGASGGTEAGAGGAEAGVDGAAGAGSGDEGVSGCSCRIGASRRRSDWALMGVAIVRALAWSRQRSRRGRASGPG